MFGRSQSLKVVSIVAILVMACADLPALGCATCGCSEVCPLTVMDTGSTDKGKSSLSDSIWGNMILKMAYQRDPEVQRLSRKLKIAGFGTTTALATVAGGTIAQGVTGMATLNPPEGHEDSYTPGIVGLCLDVGAMMIFASSPLLNYRYHKQLKARQLAIREQVEQILNHLEFSETNCPDAQKQLARLVGDRGAEECIGLWQSSHRVAATILPKISQEAAH